jgi:hypothetical protein
VAFIRSTAIITIFISLDKTLAQQDIDVIPLPHFIAVTKLLGLTPLQAALEAAVTPLTIKKMLHRQDCEQEWRKCEDIIMNEDKNCSYMSRWVLQSQTQSDEQMCFYCEHGCEKTVD